MGMCWMWSARVSIGTSQIDSVGREFDEKVARRNRSASQTQNVLGRSSGSKDCRNGLFVFRHRSSKTGAVDEGRKVRDVIQTDEGMVIRRKNGSIESESGRGVQRRTVRERTGSPVGGSISSNECNRHVVEAHELRRGRFATAWSAAIKRRLRKRNMRPEIRDEVRVRLIASCIIEHESGRCCKGDVA